MAGPDDFRRLVRRIRDIRSTFLPPADPTGNYTIPEFDRTAAFLLLSHAEVEWFIERRCLEVTSTVVTNWSNDSIPRTTIVALAAFAHGGGSTALPKPGEVGPPRVREIVDEAKKTYSAYVAQNNGIKEKNLLGLLLPIGIRESELPSGLLPEMDSFGSQRGDLAHQGVGAKTPPDPVDALERVTRIIIGLRQLDRHLMRLKAE